MLVVGIDPGVRKLAMFGIRSDAAIMMRETVVERNPERWKELGILATAVKDTIDLWSREKDQDNIVIFCEEAVVAGARNLRVAIQIAEVTGMLLALGWPTFLVPVSTWKKVTTGNGAASKQDVGLWLETEFKPYHSLCDGSADLIDAAAIAISGTKFVEAGRHRDLVGRSPAEG